MPDDQLTDDDAYRAIGRYVVMFSQLVYFMRDAMVQRLMKPGDGVQIAQLAIGEAPAKQIADSFFGMCDAAGRLDDDEKQIARQLKKRVDAEITQRNDFSHGDWWSTVPRSGHTTLVRLKPARGALRSAAQLENATKPGARSVRHLTVEELDAAADSVAELANLVTEFGALSLGHYPYGNHLRVRNVLVLTDGRVARAATAPELA